LYFAITSGYALQALMCSGFFFFPITNPRVSRWALTEFLQHSIVCLLATRFFECYVTNFQGVITLREATKKQTLRLSAARAVPHGTCWFSHFCFLSTRTLRCECSQVIVWIVIISEHVSTFLNITPLLW
jgi:hypothetical protein